MKGSSERSARRPLGARPTKLKASSKKRSHQKDENLLYKVNASSLIRREILYRPERLEYLLAKNESKTCVFCDAIQVGVSLPSLVLWRGKNTAILMNKFPYNNGHLLIIPVRHLKNLNELNRQEYLDLHDGINTCINALQKAARKCPDGFNVGINLGSAAGAGLPGHLHYHIVPRWIGDSNFFPLVGQTKVISETLEQTYERLLPCFI